MEFDKSKVYTALNADELKVGSKCIFADSIVGLKNYIVSNDNIHILTEILSEDFLCRFKSGYNSWAFAYLVSEPNKPRRMTNRELAKWLAQGNGQKATINGNAACYHIYDLDDDNKEVEDCMIRGWDEAEWHEPVIKEAAK